MLQYIRCLNPKFHPPAWRLVLLLAAFLAEPWCLCAEELLPEPAVTHDYLVENWQADEGLPRDTITSIVQDQTGYLWLGTPYGLIRFDGVRFEAWEQEVSPALARGEVWQVLSGRDSALWLTTRRSGLLRLANRAVQRYCWDSPTEPVAVDSITQDQDGILWVAMGNGKLRKFVDEKMVDAAELPGLTSGPMWFTLKTDTRGGLWFHKQEFYGRIVGGAVTNVTRIPRSVINLAPSQDGGMWLSTGNDLRRLLPGQTNSETIVAPLPFATYGTYNVRTIYEDRAGMLWVGTLKQGLFRLVDGQLQKIPGVHHIILAITEDREGNLWVGTEGGGLFKVRPRVFKLTGVPEGLPEGNVVSVSENWIVPRIGGPRKISADGSLEKPAGLPDSVISVLPDSNGGVWFGTTINQMLHMTKDGQLSLVRISQVPNRQSRVLHCDQQGNLWIGCYPAGLSVLPAGKPQSFRNPGSKKFSAATVTAIAESKEGVIWVGTSLGEIHRWNGRNFVTYGVANGLPGPPIGALMFSHADTLWVGTLGGGLGCLRDGQFKFASPNAGLPDNVLSQLIEDDLGWLWVGSSHGIFRVRLAELNDYMAGRRKAVAAVQFGRADGLQHIQCSVGYQPSVWKTAAGELRFATSKGMLTVNPSLLPVNPLPPPLVLEQVLVDGMAVTNRAELPLPHDYKRIQFHYAALSFISPDKMHYRRLLSGFDEGWIEDGQERTAAYPRLPPGRYQFRFTACNNDGVWNEKPIGLNIEVKPAFWQTGWFRLGAVLLFAGLVAAAARYIAIVRMRRKIQCLEHAHALDRERVRIARDLHDDLGARLTQIAFATDIAATELSDPVETKAQLREVSEQARQATRSLDETVWMVDPCKDSLPQLVGYLSQYANDFFRRTTISCRQQICVRPPDYLLEGELRHHVFSAAKEALTNVLKHSEATEVWLRIAVRGRQLWIVIRDNGTGFSPAEMAGSRHGIENMRRRLEAVGGSCVLRFKPGRGTRVLLRVLLPPESYQSAAGKK